MNIAILIDAENVDPLCAEQIFSYAGSIGTVTVKEIYGAGIALNEWSEPILQYAIHMNMTLRPNRYKNSSDIALVIGAMDLLCARTAANRAAQSAPVPDVSADRRQETERERAAAGIDTIIIASSDSDFSALAVRLRTAGIEVVGMGNREKTNPSWPMACSTFIPFGSAEKPAEASEPRGQERTQQPQQQQAHKPDVAPTHSARVDHIRAFLTEKLSASGGRIQSVTLFALLKELPDYRLDQQRSKRKPLDYLSRQYGEVLKVEKTPDGTIWICAPSVSADAQAGKPKDADAQTAKPKDAAPVKQKEQKDGAGQSEKAAKEPVEEQKETADPIQRFTAAGIPEETARKIVSICKESKNMRSTYNKLRKTFGGAEGGRYYQLVKQHAAAGGTA